MAKVVVHSSVVSMQNQVIKHLVDLDAVLHLVLQNGKEVGLITNL